MSRWCSNQLSYAPVVCLDHDYSHKKGYADQNSASGKLGAPNGRGPLCARLQRRRADRTPATEATMPRTLFKRPASATSTVKVIHAVPLTDWVWTPMTLVFSRAKTSEIS